MTSVTGRRSEVRRQHRHRVDDVDGVGVTRWPGSRIGRACGSVGCGWRPDGHAASEGPLAAGRGHLRREHDGSVSSLGMSHRAAWPGNDSDPPSPRASRPRRHRRRRGGQLPHLRVRERRRRSFRWGWNVGRQVAVDGGEPAGAGGGGPDVESTGSRWAATTAARCWMTQRAPLGPEDAGQLGNGSTLNRGTPVGVFSLPPSTHHARRRQPRAAPGRIGHAGAATTSASWPTAPRRHSCSAGYGRRRRGHGRAVRPVTRARWSGTRREVLGRERLRPARRRTSSTARRWSRSRVVAAVTIAAGYDHTCAATQRRGGLPAVTPPVSWRRDTTDSATPVAVVPPPASPRSRAAASHLRGGRGRCVRCWDRRWASSATARRPIDRFGCRRGGEL